MGCKPSSATTGGVRVDAEPKFLPEHPLPVEEPFVFGYRISVHNGTDQPITVLRRRWEIVDSVGRTRVVEGDGVVGQQPTIEPGETFRYSSYCPLATTWGTMEGTLRCRTATGEALDVRVGRFILVAGDERVQK